MKQLTASDRVRVAAEVGMNEQYLYQCLTGRRPMPSDRCPAIERATRGAITVKELRQDIKWIRVPDPGWPHPEGRPCIDVAAPPVPTETPAPEVAHG